MKKLSTLLLSLAFSYYSFSQDCGTGRYSSEVFASTTKTADVLYGSNTNLNGNIENFLLDVYEPVGDALSERPLIVFAHAGSFVGGDKGDGDVVPLCEDLAKMGYVTASINYRLGMAGVPFPGPDSVGATKTVIRATQDARAAIRFFRKDYVENGNTYGIDTSMIFFGGVSAGAIIAAHLAYMDKQSEWNQIATYVDTNTTDISGGLEGNSGNPGYSSEAKAIINICGALRELTWMELDDTPVVSLHGDQDQTVPYGTDVISMLGVWPIMQVSGSYPMHQQAETNGMTHCFKQYPGQDHVPHVNSQAYYDTTMNVISSFLLQYTCSSPFPTSACDNTSGNTSVTENENKNNSGFKCFPNPVLNDLNMEFDENWKGGNVKLMNAMGQTCSSFRIENNFATLKVPQTKGVYILELTKGGRQETLKVIR